MAEQQSGGFNWMKGCAIGCAVVLLILIVAGVASYILLKRTLDVGKVAAQESIAAEYKKFQDSEQSEVSDDQKALLDSLYEHSQREDIGMVAVGLCASTLMSVIEDGAVSEEEAALLQEVNGLFQSNPNPGLIDLGQFFSEHPELQQGMNQMQNTGGYTSPAPDAAEMPEESTESVEAPADSALEV